MTEYLTHEEFLSAVKDGRTDFTSVTFQGSGVVRIDEVNLKVPAGIEQKFKLNTSLDFTGATFHVGLDLGGILCPEIILDGVKATPGAKFALYRVSCKEIRAQSAAFGAVFGIQSSKVSTIDLSGSTFYSMLRIKSITGLKKLILHSVQAAQTLISDDCPKPCVNKNTSLGRRTPTRLGEIA